MGIIVAILIFGFIIFFHELGHFLLARWNGIDVQEFWIGMGPTIVHKKIGGTDYCLKALPIGGACMMGEDEVDDMSAGSFNSKGPWRRISVILAGPFFNFILAFVCALVFISIAGYDSTEITSVVDNGAAQEAGLEAGDIIKEINGKNVHIFREVQMHNFFNNGKEMEIVYERNGKKSTVELIPQKNENGLYMIGITGGMFEKGNFFDITRYSVYEVKYWIESTLKSLKMLVTGQVGMDQLSGPVGVVSIVDDAYNQSKEGGGLLILLNMLRIAILISANLGVMNLLPIPALDGGRLVFLIVEVIRGKRVPPEKEGYVHMIGMALLLALMAFVLFNDVKKLFL